MQPDYSKDGLLTEFGKTTLFDRYLLPEETSPQDGFMRACKAYATDEAHCERLYGYVSNLWLSLSTPILSNGGTSKGMPISCFGGYIGDSRQDILDHTAEVAWLSSLGGGTAGYWGNVRSNGSKTSHGTCSTGTIPFIKVLDSTTLAYSQGGTRRGSYAAYQEVSHPEIIEFINMRAASGGDENRKALNIHHGVCIPDSFMEAVEKDLTWDLIDPNSKEVMETISARELFTFIIETRSKTGEPYLFFTDTVQRAQHPSQLAKGLKVKHSQLCSEITLPTNDARTFVCCLSSFNLDKWDEWKDEPRFISDVVEFLDNIITFFVAHAPKQLRKAIYSAAMEGALGMGALGWHSLLQQKGIPFEGPVASGLNRKIFSHIKNQALQATKHLAFTRGAATDYLAYPIGDPVRNMSLLAIAPNASSSIICGGVSPSIEPWKANAYVHKTMSGSFLVKNVNLEKLLQEKYNQNTDEVWQSIINHSGSVQHLTFLEDWDKQVYKTALEIDQHWIIQHAADRQEYICQAQSVNLFFEADCSIDYLLSVHWQAWKKGLKTLYYLRSSSVKSVENIAEKIERIVKNEDEGCLSCE